MRTLLVALAVTVFGVETAHALACKPEKTKTRHVVCVVDEAGKPVKGAVVKAVRELMHEGFGDVGFSEEALGTVTTDASGAAVFAVPRVKQSWLASSRDFRRRATAEVKGWPVQGTWEDDGTIVVGPLRTVLLRTQDRRCDGAYVVTVTGPRGAHQPAVKEVRAGVFSAELGPGEYLVQHAVCTTRGDASTQRVVRGRDLGKALDL